MYSAAELEHHISPGLRSGNLAERPGQAGGNLKTEAQVLSEEIAGIAFCSRPVTRI